jgi:hypothetical protein
MAARQSQLDKYRILYWMKRTAMMQAGGAATSCDACTQPVFHIYTTGLCDNYSETGIWNAKLIQWWNTKFPTILSKIPTRFAVHVHHYDVCTPPSDTPTYLDTRVLKNDFITRLFDYNPQSPHLIFDFAHNVHYGEDGNTFNGEHRNVKAIYGGYLGDGDVGLWTSFNVDESGKVTTYIDKLIEKETKFEPSDPPKFFTSTLDDLGKNETSAVPKVTADFTQENRTNMLNEIDAKFSNPQERYKMIQDILRMLWA